MKKREYRRACKNRRRLGEGDALIARNVCALEEFLGAELVLTYLSFGSEVPTRQIIDRAWELGKRVALPRCGDAPREMSWYVVRSLDDLEKSAFGMEEPRRSTQDEVDVRALDASSALTIVPGLCFDRLGFRLGYGGGYYDEFLEGFGGVSVGLCREAELVDSLAKVGVLEEHDQPVDMIAFEGGVLRCEEPVGLAHPKDA